MYVLFDPHQASVLAQMSLNNLMTLKTIPIVKKLLDFSEILNDVKLINGKWCYVDNSEVKEGIASGVLREFGTEVPENLRALAQASLMLELMDRRKMFDTIIFFISLYELDKQITSLRKSYSSSIFLFNLDNTYEYLMKIKKKDHLDKVDIYYAFELLLQQLNIVTSSESEKMHRQFMINQLLYPLIGGEKGCSFDPKDYSEVFQTCYEKYESLFRDSSDILKCKGFKSLIFAKCFFLDRIAMNKLLKNLENLKVDYPLYSYKDLEDIRKIIGGTAAVTVKDKLKTHAAITKMVDGKSVIVEWIKK